MAFYRAYEAPALVYTCDYAVFYPASLEDGSAHEYLYFYGPFRFASEAEVGTLAPGSTPSLNSNQIEVMR